MYGPVWYLPVSCTGINYGDLGKLINSNMNGSGTNLSYYA